MTVSDAFEEVFDRLQGLPRSTLTTPLSALALSLRIKNAFRNARLSTIGDVLALGPRGIESIRNFGILSMREFHETIVSFSPQIINRPLPPPSYPSDRALVAASWMALANDCGSTARERGVVGELVGRFYALAPTLPPDILDTPVSALSLSVRTKNALRASGHLLVSDVSALGPVGLRAVRNLGMLSDVELVTCISICTANFIREQSIQHEGTLPARPMHDAGSAQSALDEKLVPLVPSGSSDTSLLESLERSLANLKPRDALAFRLRFGVDVAVNTLEEIGTAFSVSRERARQLCDRAVRTIRAQAHWPIILRDRIETYLAGRETPLYLGALVAEDAWFAGFESDPSLVGRLAVLASEEVFYSWPLTGSAIISRCSAKQWQDAVRTGRNTMNYLVGDGLTSDRARAVLVAVAIASEAPELGETLWHTLEHALHYVSDPDGSTRAVAFGNSISNALAAILRESDRPLSLYELRTRLLERANQAGYQESSANHIRGAIRRAGGVLFGRSLYGLPHHVPLAKEAIEEIVGELESIMLSDERDRQWHCAALADEVAVRRPEFADDLDAYLIDVILHRSRIARSLGRLVWDTHVRENATQERLDIQSLCENAIVAAGRPLSKTELRDAVTSIRGLNHTFLPSSIGRVIRLAHGLFGLVDRDVYLAPARRSDILGMLARLLEVRNRDLHVSEVLGVLRGADCEIPPEFDEYQLFGLAQNDTRFRVGRGYMLGLAGWGDVRRLSLSQALSELRLNDGVWPTGEALCRDVCKLLERHVPQSRIIPQARLYGFVYDTATHGWSVSSATEDERMTSESGDVAPGPSASSEASGSLPKDYAERLLHHLL